MSNKNYSRINGQVDQCPHNDFVDCYGIRNCGKCGWNPKVAQARSKIIFAKLGVHESNGGEP